jgi:hypothetical protein
MQFIFALGLHEGLFHNTSTAYPRLLRGRICLMGIYFSEYCGRQYNPISL